MSSPKSSKRRRGEPPRTAAADRIQHGRVRSVETCAGSTGSSTFHARLQVLGVETTKRLAKAADYPDMAARRSGNAPTGRCAEVRPRRTGTTRSAGPAPGDAGAVGRDDGDLPLAGRRSLSSDTYINIMGQYRPAYKVGQISRDGAAARYTEIDRRPGSDEIARAYAAARRVGLCAWTGVGRDDTPPPRSGASKPAMLLT